MTHELIGTIRIDNITASSDCNLSSFQKLVASYLQNLDVHVNIDQIRVISFESSPSLWDEWRPVRWEWVVRYQIIKRPVDYGYLVR